MQKRRGVLKAIEGGRGKGVDESDEVESDQKKWKVKERGRGGGVTGCQQHIQPNTHAGAAPCSSRSLQSIRVHAVC